MGHNVFRVGETEDMSENQVRPSVCCFQKSSTRCKISCIKTTHIGTHLINSTYGLRTDIVRGYT
jgi:hypothetical protein